MKNSIVKLRNFLLGISVIPEIVYHLLRADLQQDYCIEDNLSSYFEWVINTIEKE